MTSKAPSDSKKRASPSSTAVAAKKKKDKPSTSSSKERGKTKSTSKDKDKDKTKSSTKKSKNAASQPAAAGAKIDEALPVAAAPHPVPIHHDPDALLKDYANPPSGLDGGGSASHSPRQTASLNVRIAAFQRGRNPLSLTNTSGIPLGYERSDKNSKFEAGQLFKRYDKGRTGALTFDRFHSFFADFKRQLTAFVEDLNFYLIPHPAAEAAPSYSLETTTASRPQVNSASLLPRADADSAPEVNKKSDAEKKKPLKSRYQAALWRLRKLCKEDLFEQQKRTLETMASVRDTVVVQQRDRDLVHRSSQLASARWTDNDNSENQAAEMYEAMEEGLGRIDETGACVRRHLRKGGDVSSDEMEDFLARVSDLHEQARCLAMNDYPVSKRLAVKPSKNDNPIRQQRMSDDQSPTHSTISKMKKVDGDQTNSPSKRSPPLDSSGMNNSELTQLLRAKDQMIY